MSEQKIDNIRAQCPVLQEVAYFNTGTCGPLPQTCADAMQAESEKHLRYGRASIPIYVEYLNWMKQVQARLARLVGAASQDEMLITQHTTEGMNIVLWGLDWQVGDTIVTSTCEHGALLAPLAQLHRRFGVEVRYLPFNGDEAHDVALFEEVCATSRVRMLAMSHVSWEDGRIFPIKALAASCHAVGAGILVDGAQSVGAIPVDVQALGVDFYAAPGQKWLCAPEGTGFLYINQGWESRIHPVFTGLFGIQSFSWHAQRSPYVVPRPGADRFQTSGYCRQAIYGLDASLRWLEEEVGFDWAFARAQQMTQKARARLEALPFVSVVTPKEHRGTLLAFRVKDHPAVEIRDGLDARGVLVRDIPTATPMVRLSIGFYNDHSDLDKLFAGLKALVS